MEKLPVEIQVAKESYELGIALAKLIKAAKDALKDGAQPADIPVLLAVLMSNDVVAGIQGLEKIGDEIKEDRMAVIDALVIAVAKAVEDLK